MIDLVELSIIMKKYPIKSCYTVGIILLSLDVLLKDGFLSMIGFIGLSLVALSAMLSVKYIIDND